jgi:hypothetical protein
MLLFHLVYEWAPRFGVTLLAPAAILAAVTAVPLARRLPLGRPANAAAAVLLLALAVNIGLFLLPVRLGPLTLPEPYPGGPRLLARNADLARRDAAIARNLDPDRTLVLAYDHAFHVAWFLPDYRVVGLFPVFRAIAEPGWVPSARDRRFSFEPGSRAVAAGAPLPLPAGVDRLVLYDRDYLDFWPERDLPTTTLAFDLDRTLAVAALPGPGCLDYGFERIRFLPATDPACRAVAASTTP